MEHKDNVEVSTKEEVNTEVDTKDSAEDTENTVEEGVKDGVEEENIKEKDEDIMIPKKRFDEINDKYKDLESKLNKLKESKTKDEDVKEEASTEREKDESEVDTLTQDLEAQVKQYEDLLENMVDKKVENIPEDLRELIPNGLSQQEKLNWIEKAEEKGIFGKEEKVDVVVGQSLNHSSNQATEESTKKMNPIQLLASYYGQK